MASLAFSALVQCFDPASGDDKLVRSHIHIEGSQGPSDLPAAIQAALKRYWGYDHLRSPQAEVIDCLLHQRDALVVLPTGFGKSLCFQLPAIVNRGTTLVVSPLVALMEDQVRQLQARQLEAAALHSQMSPAAKRNVLRQLDAGHLRLLYLSPETLLSPPIWSRIERRSFPIAGTIVDEAHTVAAWGLSFRPDFMRLGAVRPSDRPFPIAAFTATAEPDVQGLLRQVLRLHNPLVVRASPVKRNIALQVKVAWTPASRVKQVATYIADHPQQSGLVYARTRTSCIDLAQKLTGMGFDAVVYHGGTSDRERRRLEAEWLRGERQFLVCTNAFGMGIDLPTVRWVVHYQPPPTVVDYVQEVGRAGRDRRFAEALLLVSEPTGLLDDSDRQLNRFFQMQARELLAQALELLKHLPQQGSYQETVRQFGPKTTLALAQLQRLGYLKWQTPFQFCLQKMAGDRQNDRRQPRVVSQWSATDGMEFLRTKGCRWQAISTALGYKNEHPCGTCDNCLRR